MSVVQFPNSNQSNKIQYRKFVDTWLQGQVFNKGKFFDRSTGYQLPSKIVKCQLRQDYVLSVAHGQKQGSLDLLDDAFTMALHDDLLSRVKQLQQNIRFDSSVDTTLLQTWLLALTGKQDPVELAVLKHWMWATKRKLYGLPVIEHIMLIFQGIQGNGKTTALKLLTDVFADFRTADLDFKKLDDSQAFEMMVNNYVGIFDEMSGADRADVEYVKKLITSDTALGRALYNSFSEHPNRISFLGASNKSLLDLIYDPTGMRRFFEIATVPIPANVLDSTRKPALDLINNMPYLALWQSIDENLSDGYIMPVKAEVAIRQLAITNKDSVQQFIEESQLDILPHTQVVSCSDLFRSYMNFCKNSNIKSTLNQNSFGRKLREHLPFLVKSSVRFKNKIARCVTVSDLYRHQDAVL